MKQECGEVRRRSKVPLFLLIALQPQGAEDPQARQQTGGNIQRESSCVSILAEDSGGKNLFLSSLTFNVTLLLYRRATTNIQLDKMTW